MGRASKKASSNSVSEEYTGPSVMNLVPILIHLTDLQRDAEVRDAMREVMTDTVEANLDLTKREKTKAVLAFIQSYMQWRNIPEYELGNDPLRFWLKVNDFDEAKLMDFGFSLGWKVMANILPTYVVRSFDRKEAWSGDYYDHFWQWFTDGDESKTIDQWAGGPEFKAMRAKYVTALTQMAEKWTAEKKEKAKEKAEAERKFRAEQKVHRLEAIRQEVARMGYDLVKAKTRNQHSREA